MKVRYLFTAGAMLSAFHVAEPILHAGVPNRIVYQGRLSQAGVSVAGTRTFVARILAQNGTPLWSSGNMSVTLPATGEFTLVLEPTGVDWAAHQPKLEISVDGETLSPADPFAASPYAFLADSVANGSITTLQIAAGAVTNEKIASTAAIDPAKIAITTTVSLADWKSSVNPAKIDANKIEGSVPAGSDTVDSDAIVDGSVTRTDIATSTFFAAGAGLVPSGAVLIFLDRTACPPGFTEVTALRNRFLIGADLAAADADVPDTVNISLGSKSHDHADPSHSHTVNSHGHSIGAESPGTNGVGDHQHLTPIGTNSAGFYVSRADVGSGWPHGQSSLGGNRHGVGASATSDTQNYMLTGGAGSHSHTVNSHSHGGSTGSSSPGTSSNNGGNTGTTSILPPALTCLFCQKD
jgi:hypothetical protein